MAEKLLQKRNAVYGCVDMNPEAVDGMLLMSMLLLCTSQCQLVIMVCHAHLMSATDQLHVLCVLSKSTF